MKPRYAEQTAFKPILFSSVYFATYVCCFWKSSDPDRSGSAQSQDLGNRQRGRLESSKNFQRSEIGGYWPLIAANTSLTTFFPLPKHCWQGPSGSAQGQNFESAGP